MRTLSTSLTLGLALLVGTPAVRAAEVPAPPALAVPTAPAAGELRDTLQPGLSTDAVRRYTKALTARNQGELEDAKQQLLSLTIDYPSYYNALVLLGGVLDFARERKIAIDTMERALKVQKEEKIKDAEAAYRLGLMYMETIEPEKARDSFQAGIDLESTNSAYMNGRLYNGLANAELLMDNTAKGMEYHKVAAEKYGSQVSQATLNLIADKAAIDKQIQRADKAIKPDAATAYDITTTLPLPPEEEEAPKAGDTPKAPEAKDTTPVGADTVGGK